MRFVSSNIQKGNQTLKKLLPAIHSTNHDQLKFYCFPSSFSLYTEKLKVGGNKIVVGMVVKSKIGELEEEVWEGTPRKMRKKFTGVMLGVSGRRRFLERFQNG